LKTSPSPRSRFLTAVAVVITSLFFAAVHGPQWPAPIPLFVLALAIGTLYHRTGSLIAAICMHAVFNGFSMLGLIIMLLVGHPGEGEKAIPPPALERPAPVGNGNPRPETSSPYRAKENANRISFFSRRSPSGLVQFSLSCEVPGEIEANG